MRSVTLNIRGVSPSKLKQLKLWGELRNWHAVWDYGSGASNGVALLLNKDTFPKEPTNTKSSGSGRWVWAEVVSVSGKALRFASVYAPSTEIERTSFLENLNFPSDGMPTYAGGDWNTVVRREDRSTNTKSWQPPPSTRAFLNMCERLGLKDTSAREVYTFRTRASKTLSLVDRWLINEEASRETTSSKVIPYPWSDHDVVELACEGKKKAETKNLWMLNVSVLKDRQLVEMIKEAWKYRDSLTQKETDPTGWWDDTKLHIRTMLRTAARTKNGVANAKRAELNRWLESNPPTKENWDETEGVRSQLRKLKDDKLEGMLVRSRAKWCATRDRPMPALLRAIRKKKSKRPLEEVLWKGVTYKENKGIIEAAEEFYTDLFAEKKSCPDVRERMIDQVRNKLCAKSREKLEAPVTREELSEAAKGMSNGKTPGLDGLPVKLYKAIPQLTEGVETMWKAASEKGELSKMTQVGKLCILHKKDEKNDLKNYRPLTLMNTDYKLIAKVLANRLREVITEVVGQQQTGFIRGRNIKFNVMEAYLVAKHKRADSHGAIVLLDFEKAYDRVNRTWLWEVMEKMNFGQNFIHMIQALHQNSSVVLSINGDLSNRIPVTGGVRQGCPIAPHLFAISTEPLRSLSDSGTRHQGITTLGVKSTVGMYADDTTGYVSGREDLLLFLDEVEEYCLASGGQLNIRKSAIIFLGREFECAPLQVIKRGKVERLLRFMLGVDATQKEIHKPMLEKFIDRCAQWVEASHSIVGKTALVRIFAESTLEFTAPFHAYSKEYAKVIRIAYWRGIYERETSTRLNFADATNHTKEGGIGALNIELRLVVHLALWVPLANEKANERWAKLLTRSLGCATPNKQGDVVEASKAWWEECRNRITKPEDQPWKVKWTYKALLPRKNTISPKIQAAPGDWKANWTYLDEMPVNGRAGETRWRNWLGKLKVRREGKEVTRCTECDRPGDSAHVLNTCKKGIRLLNEINKESPSTLITTYQWTRDWIPSTNATPTQGTQRAADIVMTLAKAALWRDYTSQNFGGNPGKETAQMLAETKCSARTILTAWKTSKDKNLQETLAALENWCTRQE